MSGETIYKGKEDDRENMVKKKRESWDYEVCWILHDVVKSGVDKVSVDKVRCGSSQVWIKSGFT